MQRRAKKTTVANMYVTGSSGAWKVTEISMFGGLEGLVSGTFPALRGKSKEESCRWRPLSKSVVSQVQAVAARRRCSALRASVVVLLVRFSQLGHTRHELRACDFWIDQLVFQDAGSFRSIEFVGSKGFSKHKDA